ncbi:MAG: 3-dehydroquinate synthase [Firmicutes bacterium]|nr:3-dehydroquinate synthase [Bacillota bacterium]
MADNVVLIGFMGAGKTAVGRRLAERLGRPFVDADQVVEESAGMSIRDIFAREGEAGFRRREAEAVRRLAARRGQVIATGGGAVMERENLRALRATGTLVWLRAPIGELLARARASGGRPLLERSDFEVRALYARREPVYALADLVVDTQGSSPEQVAIDIEQRLAAGGAREAAAVDVELSAAPYRIHVGHGLLGAAGQLAREAGVTGRCLLVTNPTVGRLYAGAVLESLVTAGFEAGRIDIPDGEEHKTVQTAEYVWRAAVSHRLDRRSFFCALGGGVVGDVAGFAAATYMRGVSIVQVPTTLLAQVDASVGGKTGVNLPEGKNLVGAFHQPKLVIADVAALRTLSARELSAGMAEVVKYGAIADPHLLDFLEDRMDQLLAGRPAALVRVVARSCEVKARVVVEDERETGGRREVLNFGHTVGHGLEALGGYRTWLHGEAVAIGMVTAALVSERLGRISRAETERIVALLRRAGLPTVPPAVAPEQLLQVMARDKKVLGGRQRFVLLRGLGCAEVEEVDGRWILEALAEQRAL